LICRYLEQEPLRGSARALHEQQHEYDDETP
jgi:hypothetical protein